MGNNPRFSPPFTQQQSRTMVILPKIGAIPSLLATPFVIRHIVSSKHRRQTVYHRIVLAMTCHDLLMAILQFLGTWPNPEGTGWLAVGTMGTCTASGFLRQGALLSSILYSANLTLFFLLVVKYGWRESRIVRYVEPWMHAISLCLGWGTAVTGLVLDLYAPFEYGCGVVAYPRGCTQSYQSSPENPANCTRGDNAGIFTWAFATGPIWATFVFLIVAMTCMYHSIRQKERKSEQYDFVSNVTAATTARVAKKESTKGLSEGQQQQTQSHPSTIEAISTSTMSNCSLASSKPENETTITREPSQAITEGETEEVKEGNSSTMGTNTTAVSMKEAAATETEESNRVKSSNSEPASVIATSGNRMASTTNARSFRARRRRKSREFAMQALLYCVFFFLSFMFGSVTVTLINWGPEQPYSPILMLQTLFGPMLGFFNFLVYIRPRFVAYRRRHPTKSFWSIVCTHIVALERWYRRRRNDESSSGTIGPSESVFQVDQNSSGSWPLRIGSQDPLREKNYLE